MSNRRYIVYLILASGSFLLLINFQSFIYLLTSTVMPGWDGAGHFAIAKVYADEIFPAVWGWINNWYLGMPFPQFYPPAFYFLVALSSKILFFLPYDFVFRIFVFFSLFLVPGTVAWCALGLTNNKKVAALAGLFTALLLSFHGQEGNFGVSVTSTINTGLIPQTLGFLFLVIWIRYFLDDPKIFKNYVLGTIFLTLTTLTNVHLVFPCLVFYIVSAIINLIPFVKRKKFKDSLVYFFKYYIWRGVLSIGLTSFWLLPMFYFYPYFLTEVMSVSSSSYFYTYITFSYIPFFLMAACCVALIYTQKQKKIITLSIALFLLTICVFFISKFVNADLPLPLHFIRWIPPVIYMFPIIFAYVVIDISERLPQRPREWIYVTALIFITLATFIHIFVFKKDDGIYSSADRDGYAQLLNYFTTHNDGLVLVGVNTDDNVPVSFAIDAGLGARGVRTLFSNIRESSLDGLYLTPIRNLFSSNPEGWGINSYLSFDDQFLNGTKPITRADIIKYIGVRYVVTTTNDIYNKLKKSKLFKLEKRFDNFAVFELKDYSVTDQVELDHEPIGLFSDIGTKNRKDTDVTFSRFAEEWLYNFNPQIVYFRPNTNLIEDNPVFRNAGAIVLASYSYKNIQKAETEIENFSQNKLVIIFDRSDQLSIDLKDKVLPNVYFLSLPTDTEGHKFRDIYPYIQKLLLSYQKNASTTAVLIKESYFPTRKINNQETYMATPAFTMTFNNSEPQAKLIFTTPRVVYIGYLVSLICLLLLFNQSILVFLKKLIKINQ